MADLIWFNRARDALARASQLDEVTEIRDKAEALRVYTKQAGEGLQMQNWCAEIKIRAERRAGQLLREIDKHKGGNPNLSHDMTGCPPTLGELGLNRNQSSHYQAIASLPEKQFETHIAETKAQRKELTSAGVYRQARKYAPVKASQPRGKTPPTDTVDSKGRTPYVHWVNGLRQFAGLLTEINQLGGFDAIMRRLTPAQVEDVIAQAHRLNQQVKILVDEINRAGGVVNMTLSH